MLDKDITLTFQSIHMINGHAGYEVRFIAATREVKQHSYCVQKRKLPFLKDKTVDNEDTLSIPETVTTEQALREYIRSNRPNWLLDM